MNAKDITIFQPSWSHLKSFFEDARHVFICAPWISKEGVSFLRSMCEWSKVDRAEIWTRLEPSDYVMGISDYVGLLTFIKEKERQIEFSIKTAPNLHLKIYKADGSKVIVTSANLTYGGFKENIEIGVLITNEKLLQVFETHLKSLEAILHQITIGELEDFVKGLEKIGDLHRSFESWKRHCNERCKKLKTYPAKAVKKISKPPYLSLR